jgi:nucleotide-binding universal stress UspA family protein
MKKLFNHILVPVNFNRNTAMLLGKAIQVANRFDCDIHLLYVQKPMAAIPFLYDGHVSGAVFNHSEEEAETKLKALADENRHLLADGLLMTSTVLTGSWQLMLKEEIITKHIDLVILPKNEKKFFGALIYTINVNQLSQQTQCAVLTVTKEFEINHLHNIVVPVGNFLPIRKLTAATYMARKFDAVIHLMGGRSHSYADDKQKNRSLTRSYQLLRDYTNVKVCCSAQQENSSADETLSYANNVKADLIVVNSGRESMFKGWFSKWLGHYLYRDSNIPVLTIAPKV